MKNAHGGHGLANGGLCKTDLKNAALKKRTGEESRQLWCSFLKEELQGSGLKRAVDGRGWGQLPQHYGG